MLEFGNVALRAATMASRLVLLFVLARLLPPAEVGLYGLVAATVTYGVLAVGLDFYTYSTRELLGHDRRDWPALLRNQAALHATVYLFALPAASALFVFDVLPWEVAGWFAMLLVAEHLAKELNRLLIVTGRPIAASTALFLHRGLWALLVPVLMLQFTGLRDLRVVFLAWSVSVVAAVVVSAWFLREHGWRGLSGVVDWSWIRRGVRVASVLLLASLFLQGMFTVDRYIVEGAGGLDLVGVYTFYIGIAMSAMSFLDAGVFAFLYPRVVSAFKTGSTLEFRAEMRNLLIRTGLATAATIGAAAAAVPFILRFLDRPIYQAHVGVFWLILSAVAVYALGMVPHFGLYAMGRDRAILLSQGGGFFVFLGVAVVGSTAAPLEGVAAGLLAGAAVIGIAKTWRYLALQPLAARRA